MISWRLTFLTWRMRLSTTYVRIIARIRSLPYRLRPIFGLKPKEQRCFVARRHGDGEIIMTTTLFFPTGMMLNDHRLDQSLPVDASADEVKALLEKTLSECKYIDRSYPLPSTAGWVKYAKEHDEIFVVRELDAYRLIPEVLDKPSGRTGKRPAKQGEITVPVTANSEELLEAFNAAFRIIQDEAPS